MAEARDGQTLAQLEHWGKALGEVRKSHCSATLNSVASGGLIADEAIARVDALRVTRVSRLALRGAIIEARAILRKRAVHAPASAATTTFRKEPDERMISFSASREDVARVC